MKKFIYIALLALVSSLTIVSCTEEEVAPSTENGGTNVTTDRHF
jgi:hypothetical protein